MSDFVVVAAEDLRKLFEEAWDNPDVEAMAKRGNPGTWGDRRSRIALVVAQEALAYAQEALAYARSGHPGV